MNVSLDNVVNINISVSPTPISLVGFGGFMILQNELGDESGSEALSSANPIKKYMNAQDVAVDFASDTVAYKAAIAFFSQSPTPSEFYVGANTESTIVASLNNILNVNSDWYHFCALPIQSADLVGDGSIPAWAEANKKMMYIESSLNSLNANNADILDGSKTDDLASTLQAGSYKHVALIYNTNPNNVGAIEASVAGRIATVDFNNGTDSTITLHLKELPTIFPEGISNADLGILRSKNCNVFTKFATSQLLADGMTTEGSFIDQTVGLDWLENFIQINLFNFMKGKNKIPYTIQGVEMLGQNIESSLKQGVTNGFIAPQGTTDTGEFLENGFKVDTGDFDAVTVADKADRKYDKITFKAILAGAIHSVTVNGVVEF